MIDYVDDGYVVMMMMMMVLVVMMMMLLLMLMLMILIFSRCLQTAVTALRWELKETEVLNWTDLLNTPLRTTHCLLLATN